MHQDVVDRQAKLSQLFQEAKSLQELKGKDHELTKQFAWYLCIRTSGFVEFSIQTILSEYYASCDDYIPLGYFVVNHLLHHRSFSMMRVSHLLQSFMKTRGNILGDTDLSQLESAIESLRLNRNNIAHGRDSDLTIEDMDTYFEDAKQVIRIVFEECDSRYSPFQET